MQGEICVKTSVSEAQASRLSRSVDSKWPRDACSATPCSLLLKRSFLLHPLLVWKSLSPSSAGISPSELAHSTKPPTGTQFSINLPVGNSREWGHSPVKTSPGSSPRGLKLPSYQVAERKTCQMHTAHQSVIATAPGTGGGTASHSCPRQPPPCHDTTPNRPPPGGDHSSALPGERLLGHSKAHTVVATRPDPNTERCTDGKSNVKACLAKEAFSDTVFGVWGTEHSRERAASEAPHTGVWRK